MVDLTTSEECGFRDRVVRAGRNKKIEDFKNVVQEVGIVKIYILSLYVV